MIGRLVWASFRRRPVHGSLLLGGYAMGVGVTVVLLSIGGALLEQARDKELLGGGDLAVLPAGIDLETLKTGGTSSMFHSIDQATLLYRDVLAGPRLRDRVAAVAPWIDGELLYLESDSGLVAVSAAATIPSLAERLGAAPDLIDGRWSDVEADRLWRDPTDAELYRSIDALHVPTGPAAQDSTWAEWHYFNALVPGSGWLYITYMIGGRFSDGRWGGRLLATRVEPGADDRVYESTVDASEVEFAAGLPDLAIGRSSVTVGADGAYRLIAEIPAVRGSDVLAVDLTVASPHRRYLPPVDVGGERVLSGYVVPMLDARASGRICEGARCRTVNGSRAYHDHNWGTWSAVTWDWGQARTGEYSVLYGGVTVADSAGAARAAGPRFLYLVDDLGFAGVLPIRTVATAWSNSGPGAAPESISVVAAIGADSLTLHASVDHARATSVPTGGGGAMGDAVFFQLRGDATLTGRLRGAALHERGDGFFETWCTDCTASAQEDPP